MYKNIIRPILFCFFKPESIHFLVVKGLKLTFSIPGVAFLVKSFFCVNYPKLKRELFGLNFDNPVGMAAGFDKEANLYNELKNFGFSHIEIGTVTPKGQKGNPKPRLFRLTKDKALINRMGFNNKGVKKAAENLKKNKPEIIIGCNIGKNTDTPNEDAVNDYCEVFDYLHEYVDYFVVNISCPNIKDLDKLQNKDNTKDIIIQLQNINNDKPKKKPLLIKISPDLNEQQIDDIIDVVKETKIDGIVATNTTTKRDNLFTNKNKVEKIGNGGLSGQPIKNRSTEVIRYISKKTEGKVPIIGVGGIFSPKDAAEKLEAGASLIQGYTGFIYEGPGFVKKINKYLKKLK